MEEKVTKIIPKLGDRIVCYSDVDGQKPEFCGKIMSYTSVPKTGTVTFKVAVNRNTHAHYQGKVSNFKNLAEGYHALYEATRTLTNW